MNQSIFKIILLFLEGHQRKVELQHWKVPTLALIISLELGLTFRRPGQRIDELEILFWLDRLTRPLACRTWEEELPDPGVPGVRSMGPGLSNSVTIPFWNFADVTLADEDTNSTSWWCQYHADRAIPSNTLRGATAWQGDAQCGGGGHQGGRQGGAGVVICILIACLSWWPCWRKYRLLGFWVVISGDTLCRDNRRLIGTPLIVIAWQSQKNRD